MSGNCPKRDGQTAAVLQALGAGEADDVLTDYTTVQADLDGPFTPEIPDDLIEQSSLPALGYRTPLEMLGERFHASPTLLQRLNPGATLRDGRRTDSRAERRAAPSAWRPAAPTASRTSS